MRRLKHDGGEIVVTALADEVDAAVRRHLETGDDAQQGALATPALPDHCVDAAIVDGRAQTAQNFLQPTTPAPGVGKAQRS